MNGNNDDLFLQYMLEMGALSPEEEKLMRQQSMVDSLRENAMSTQQGKMVGNTYVAPSWAQYASQLGNAYMAKKGQGKLDEGYNEYTGKLLSKTGLLRDAIAKRKGAGVVTPSGALPVSGMGAVTKRPYDEENPYGP